MPGGLEASLASLEEQSVQFRFTVSAGFGFRGDHVETAGLDSNGDPTTPGQHQHEVTMNMMSIQPSFTFAALEDWNLEVLLPLRLMQRKAKIVPIDDMNDEQLADAQRNLDIHHPSKTLKGVGDLAVMFRSRTPDVPWSWGVTLPTGTTEEDPYVLGADHLAHEHVQFGTGTVVPRLEYRALNDGWITMVALMAPVYANRHGFTAPPELTLFSARRGQLTDVITWTLGASARAQGYGDWNGTRDINTGYGALVADAGLSWNTESGTFHLGATFPLAQRLWQDGSDAFELGPSVAFSFAP